MAEMTIRLNIDPETGKKNIIIGLSGEEDMLPHEHEEQHRALVDRLIEGGLVTLDELGSVTVERQEEGQEQETPETESAPEERQAQPQGE